MNKKLVLSIVLISIFCLTIVSALSVGDAFDTVIKTPLNKIFFNRFTGESIKDITGMQVQDPTKKINITDCSSGVGITGCENAYDGSTTTAFAFGDLGFVDVKFNFATSDVGKIHIYPGGYFKSPKLFYSNNPNVGVQIPELPAGRWHEIPVNRNSLQWIRIEWDTGGYHLTGLFEVEIEEREEILPPEQTECTDDDGGKNAYVRGTATKNEENKTDQCIRQQFTGDQKWSGAWPSSDCKVGDAVPGGFMGRCDVYESYCDGGNIKQEYVECKLGICYQGECACNRDIDCGPNYKCTKYNLNLDSYFCEQVTPSEGGGCLLDNNILPIGTRRVINNESKYCGLDDTGIYAWINQTLTTEQCINNYECVSNLCFGGVCVEQIPGEAPQLYVGCMINNTRLPIGTRKAGEYCGVDDTGNYDMLTQEPTDNTCENDYECVSNVCVQGTCTEPRQETGLLMRIWCTITLNVGAGC